MTTVHEMPKTKRFQDLTGITYGRLTVKHYAGKAPCGKPRWVCHCSCGGKSTVLAGHLRSGRTKSCGCYGVESSRKNGQACTTHGMGNSPEYQAWSNMWERVTNPKGPGYHLYKDRRPPDSWRDFEVFYAEIGPRPSSKHSLDRIKNHLPYGPGNIRWATRGEQSRNSSRNLNLTYRGVTQCMTDWAKEAGLSHKTVSDRLRAGWSVDRALTSPLRATRRK